MAEARRFRRKPEIIEAVQFDGTLESRPPGVKLNRVGARFMLKNELRKTWQAVKPGDWIRVDKAPAAPSSVGSVPGCSQRRCSGTRCWEERRRWTTPRSV